MSIKLIEIDLPPVAPRKTWCQRVLDAAVGEAEILGVTYDEHDRLVVDVLVYMTGRTLEKSDVDNLLVRIMNGLQGQVGGKGKKIMNPERRLIRNDRQIWRAQIEKRERPTEVDSRVGGRLRIQSFGVAGNYSR